MNKLFFRSNLLLLVASAGSVPTVFPVDTANANPIKNCPPVVRSLKTNHLYCAHELKILKQQRTEEKGAGFLCLFVRAIIPPNNWIKANQCFPKVNFSAETGKKIIPRPKGARTALKLLKPVGSIQHSKQPVIAWQPVPNARYRITLEQGGQWLWSHESNATEIQLPVAQSLTHGQFYKLSVVAFRDTQPIAEDETTIQLVDPKQLREIDDAIQQAQQLAPNPLDRGLDKAMMLYHVGLLDAAVDELRSLTQFQEPAVYSQLGLIYEEAGHKKMAQEYLDKAVELAKVKPNDLSKLN